MARTHGAVNKKNLLGRMEQTLNSHAHPLLVQIIDQAGDGCVQSQKLLIDKIMPNLKAESKKVVFELKGETLSAKAESVLDAVAGGEIALDVAQGLLSSISNLLAIKEKEALEMRIEALEDALKAKG